MALSFTVVQAGGQTVIGTADNNSTPQTSTASTVVVTGSDIDARGWKTVAYNVKVATNAVKWSVFGANQSDFSDEVAVLSATTVASGAAGTYAVSPAPYSYYRAKVIDDSGGVHGDITFAVICKR